MISYYWLMMYMSVAIWGLIFLQIGYILNQAYQHGLIDGNKKFIFGG